MRSSCRTLWPRRGSSPPRARFVALNMVLALVAVLVPTALIPAGAAASTSVNFTLEGCRNNGGITLPNGGGDFICPDAAYTTGNLGKGWNELDLVPFRLTAGAGTSAPATQTYSLAVVLDNQDAGHPGYDVLSVPVLNTALSSASCTAAVVGPQLAQTPGLGGADASIYRIVTINQVAGSTCVYDYYGRLALGSHLYPGSSLHANLANEALGTAGIGSKEVSIPVKEILPQELRKDMTATQGSDHVWNVTKTASPANVAFDQTCTDITAGLSQPVTITVTWTKLAASPSGDITVVTNIYAKNPAARVMTVNVSDQIYSGITAIGAPVASGTVDVPANSEALVLTHTTTVPSGTTALNDIATATYTDLVTGVPVRGSTTATASATVQPSTSETNQTATITDVESIAGSGFSYSVDSSSGAIGTFGGSYTAGTKTTAPVSWTSAAQSDSGSATFLKTVYATAGQAGSGTLSDIATLTGSNGFITDAHAAVALTAVATVSLAIDKTIPDVLTGEETVTFAFDVFDADGGLVASRTIGFSAGHTTGSASVSGLAPGTYTVHEVPESSGDWGTQADQTVTITLPHCQGSVAFANTRNTGDLSVVKVTTGGTGTFRFDVDCDRDAYDRKGDHALVIVGSGTASVTGIPTGTSCTVTERANPLFSSVVIPAGGTVAIASGANLVSFTNTANPIGITLDKKVNGADHATSGDALLAHSGDPLAYAVVITNTGQLPLTITSLADTLRPGFAATCSQGIGSVLAPAASFTCTYQLTADGDATNLASVTGVDGLDRDVTAQDSTFVKVITPAIGVVKTVDNDKPLAGQTVIYTYVVTNTGDTTLSGVTVVDDVLGAIGAVDTLVPGASATLTKTMVVTADSPTRNVATAAGTDVLGQKVTALDDATIAVTAVLGLVVVKPEAKPEVTPAVLPATAELPRTGLAVGGILLLGFALLFGGLALRATRRRRPLA